MYAPSEQVTPSCGIPPERLDAGSGRPSFFWISCVRADRLGQSFRFDRDELVLGRAADADLVVDDLGASRRHAKLTRGPDGDWTITDLGSTNGTYVNRTRVSTPTAVGPGDEIRMGKATLELRR
jgi:predicted component of type VI protein secretion system